MREALLLATGLLASGCAAQRPPIGTVTSNELVFRIQKEGIHDSYWVVDVHNHGYELKTDEPVRAPTPPDGGVRVTTVRELIGACAVKEGTSANNFSRKLASPGGEPCWLAHPLAITPVREVDDRHTDPKDVFLAGGIAAAVIGGVGGTIYCAVDCPKPWNVVVPVGVPVVLLVALLAALSHDVSHGFHFMQAPGPVRF